MRTSRRYSEQLGCGGRLLLASALLAAGGAAWVTPNDAWAATTELLFAPTGEAAGDGFGSSVANVGDFNGDGFDDVLVGSPYNSGVGIESGRAYLYYGGTGADTVPDLVFTGEAAGDQFGYSVAAAGDVDGDGFADIIVGARLNDAAALDAGRAYVFYGGAAADSLPDLVLTGEANTYWFGHSVAGAGDVNGDGFDDVIVGAPHDFWSPPYGTFPGRAYVYFGGPGADGVADLGWTGENPNDEFGEAVSGVGDVNGDGFADVAVGAPGNDAGGVSAGRAYVYFGGPGADASADLGWTGEAAGDLFGAVVSGAGDVNGDGLDDIVVGAYGNGPGSAYVFYGGPTADLVLTGETVGDVFGSSAACAGDVNRDGYDDVIIGAQYSSGERGRAYIFYGGTGADTMPDLIFNGEAAGDRFGAVSGAADVDGDGVGDFLIGAPLNETAGAGAGRAYVYTTFAYRLLSPNGGERWDPGAPSVVRWEGHDVADIDLSVDGGLSWSTLISGVGGAPVNEFMALAPTITTDGARIRVCYTGQTATFATSDMSDAFFRIGPPPPPVVCGLQIAPAGTGISDNFGISVSGAGDINADGFDDFLVGARHADGNGFDSGKAYLYHGGPGADALAELVFVGEAAGDRFGYSVSGAGDFNADGFPDILIGALDNDAGGVDAGRAYLYYGGPAADTTADLTFTGEAANDRFGYSTAGCGDLNGDGFDDIIVGAYQHSPAGRAYVYYGGPGADAVPDLVVSGETLGDLFGYPVGGAGDVNGDGFNDFLVGAQHNDAGGAEAGRAYVYFGGPAIDTVADLVLTGETADDWFGYACAGAGDVNGDGFDDVVVGTYRNDAGGTDAGRVYLFYGGPYPDNAPDLVLTGNAGDFFGVSVAGIGDANADGFDDFLIGAPEGGSGGTEAGRVYVYFGGSGSDPTADLMVVGESAGDNFGGRVSGAGDLNGDGFNDFVVGAILNDSPLYNAGRAYVYDCNRYVVTSPTGGDTWNVGSEASIAWLGSEPADVWLSVDGGSNYTRLRANSGGEDENAITLTVPHQPTRFAKIKLTPSNFAIVGHAESDSLFTIEASIALLNLKAEPQDGGGVLLSWETDPGPENLAGYKLERRSGSGGSWRVLASLLRETEYLDATGASGMRYRLSGINGLGDELLLGETALTPRAALAAWPLPYRGGELNLAFATYGGRTGAAQVAVFDLRGRLVRTVVDGTFAVGHQITTWDGRDAAGRDVPSGVYFLRVTSAGESNQLKLVIAR